MIWRIGPWREVAILKERVQACELALERVKAREVFWKAEAQRMYLELLKAQKGALRLRRALNRELVKRITPQEDTP